MLIVPGDGERLPRRVADLLKREAKRDIEALVAKHTASIGKRARAIRFRDTKSRWGSCTSDGALSFSWRIMMAPPLVREADPVTVRRHGSEGGKPLLGPHAGRPFPGKNLLVAPPGVTSIWGVTVYSAGARGATRGARALASGALGREAVTSATSATASDPTATGIESETAIEIGAMEAGVMMGRLVPLRSVDGSDVTVVDL